MYKIQGPFDEKPQAIEQDLVVAKNLNSNDAFFVVAKGGDAAYYWIGEGASEDEAAYAKKLADILAPGASVKTGFKEGEETDETIIRLHPFKTRGQGSTMTMSTESKY